MKTDLISFAKNFPSKKSILGLQTHITHKHLIIIILMLFMSFLGRELRAQGVGIGAASFTPVASSILELQSTTKGFLAPRMLGSERTAIAAPATGLLVYDTTANSFYCYNGATWVALAAGSSVNGLTLTPLTTGFSIAGGTTSKTLTVNNTLGLSGTDNSTLNIGAGGTLGTNAFTSTAFAPLASPTFTGTVTIPTPFTIGAVSMTSTGTQLNYLNAATGTTGTTSTNLVFSTSPTLVTPNLGTPSALVGTNITGTAVNFTAGTASNLAGGSGGTIPYQSAAGTTAMLTNGTAGQVLKSNGTTLAPTWATVSSPTDQLYVGTTAIALNRASAAQALTGITSIDGTAANVTGTVAIANGGTGQTAAAAAFNALSPVTTLGDLIYGSGANASSRLAGNTTLTKQFLTQTGNGTISAAPSWGTLAKADVGLGNVENTALSTWAGTSNITTLGTIATGTWNATTIGVAKGGTGSTSAQAAINSLAGAVTSGQYLRGNGTNVVMSAIQAADVPTLNQNTTGSAATATTATNFSGSLVGDVGGTQGATSIGANKVTYAKIQNVAAGTLLGNPTASPAVPSEITVSTGLNLSALGVLTATGTGGTVTNVTGTAPIVSSGGNTPAISISAATTGAAGSMSAADKTKLDGIAAGAIVGVVPNTAITPGTNTKITYDAKGLVTGGTTLGTGDIPNLGAAPLLTLGTSNIAGAATTYISTNSTILAFDATVPVALGTAAVGSATVAARRDHVHPAADLASGEVTGTLPVGNGGTGSTTQNWVDLTTTQTAAGAKTWSGLGTFNAGITSTGAAVNLNAGSNFATNINTGTSTGAVNIANGGTGVNAITIGNTNGATSITENVGSGNYTLNGAAGSTYTIGAATTTGTITIGGTAQTGAIGIGTGTGAQTINVGTGATGIKTINIGNNTQGNLIYIGSAASHVSIGTVATPTYPLEVGSSTAPVQTFTSGKYGTTANGTTWTNTTTNLANPAISIKAAAYIWGVGILSSSDLRAKENIESRNPSDALTLVNKLNPVKYNWIDRTKSNHKFEDGFIAQEAEKVMPEVVSTNTEVIPNIMEYVDKTTLINKQLAFHLNKADSIKANDLVKIIAENGKEYKCTVSSVNKNQVTLNTGDNFKTASKIFVYGKEVKDFKTVDYNRIFTVGISAIQELSHQNDSIRLDNKSLHAELNKVQVDYNSFKANTESEISKLKALVERLAAESHK